MAGRDGLFMIINGKKITEKTIFDVMRKVAKKYSLKIYRLHGSLFAGLPDLLIIDKEHKESCFIEVKIGKAKLTESQKEFYENVNNSCILYVINKKSELYADFVFQKTSGLVLTNIYFFIISCTEEFQKITPKK